MRASTSLYTLFILSLIVSACSKDDPGPGINEKGALTLHFDNEVGDKDLILNTETYTNTSGETFTITTLRYFVSNIALKTSDGLDYVIPKDSSYFLIDQANEQSHDIVLKDIPAADYNQVTFTIGVDSLKSTSDISQRVGVLDPTASGMYWAWNSGYIFLKLEGTSSAAPAMGGIGNMFQYHVGGYGGYNASSKTLNNIRQVTLSFGSKNATVRSKIDSEVHIYADILKIFNGDPALSIAEHPMVMLSDYAVNIANNYSKMFEFGHVHNDPKEENHSH